MPVGEHGFPSALAVAPVGAPAGCFPSKHSAAPRVLSPAPALAARTPRGAAPAQETSSKTLINQKGEKRRNEGRPRETPTTQEGAKNRRRAARQGRRAGPRAAGPSFVWGFPVVVLLFFAFLVCVLLAVSVAGAGCGVLAAVAGCLPLVALVVWVLWLFRARPPRRRWSPPPGGSSAVRAVLAPGPPVPRAPARVAPPGSPWGRPRP